MPAQAVTLQLPAALYEYFERLALGAHRSVEAVLLEAVTTAAPEVEELPPDIAETLEQLAALDDEALWQIGRSHLSHVASAELENLHLKRQSEGLSPQESSRASQLVGDYERSMALRAHAARLLKERGFDVSSLLNAPGR